MGELVTLSTEHSPETADCRRDAPSKRVLRHTSIPFGRTRAPLIAFTASVAESPVAVARLLTSVRLSSALRHALAQLLEPVQRDFNGDLCRLGLALLFGGRDH